MGESKSGQNSGSVRTMERDSFIFYRSFRLAAQALSKEERADLYDAICDYALDGKTPESFEGAMLGIFYMAQMQIDINNEKYKKKVEARREAGRKSGEARRNEQTGTKRTNVDFVQQNEQTGTKRTDNDTVNDTVNDTDNVNGNGNENVTVNDTDNGIKNDNNIPPKSPQGDGEKKPSLQERRFESFWSVYPKKKAKDAARRAWMRLKPDENLCATIVESVSEHIARDPSWSKDGGQYIPHPATYLNSGGWQDEFGQKQPELEYDPDDPYKWWT